MVLDGLCLALLVLITVDFVILVGGGLVMGSPPGLGECLEVFIVLLGLFGYASGSARALLAWTVPLRYCTTRFASRIPAWRLPVSGHVACLVTADHEASGSNGDEVSRREVHLVSGSGPGRTRI